MEFIYGFGCGGIVVGFWSWRIHRACSGRVRKHLELSTLSKDLERRRDAIEFGSDTVTPPGAGPAGQENVLFRIRPGALHKSRDLSRDSLDSQQVSRTMDYGSQDHPLETDEG